MTRLPLAVEWLGGDNGFLRLIDQTKLPSDLAFLDCNTPDDVWQAIRILAVRGAPAIGVAAAYGVVLEAQRLGLDPREDVPARIRAVAKHLKSSRPTAVNLAWAVDRMVAVAEKLPFDSNASEYFVRLLAEAHAILEEDGAMCREIGRHGAPLLPDTGGVLTHCNAGALATAQYGTALGVIRSAWEAGKRFSVFVDETRPLLQGARLTAWELNQQGIDHVLICDNMAGHFMKQRQIRAVVVGADRIAANGDTANKIGTYAVAVLAKHHGIPFYVAAPSSTFDLSLVDGSMIPIEERDPHEITEGLGRTTAPPGTRAWNPAFDVTPADLIAAIITERGVIQPVSTARVAEVLHVSQS